MNQNEQKLLDKLGIMISGLEYEYPSTSSDPIATGNFMIDASRFGPMCRLIHIVDMLNESKNPAIEEQFHHLITMLELSKENKDG